MAPKQESEGCGLLREENRTFFLRMSFVASMLVLAAVFSTLAYKITRNQEDTTAIETYRSVAASALIEARAIVNRRLDGADVLAVGYGSWFPYTENWPYVGLTPFHTIAGKVADVSDSEGHVLSPIVTPEGAAAFEAYAADFYSAMGYSENAGMSDFGFGIFGSNYNYSDPSAVGEEQRFHDVSGNTSWGGKFSIMVPILQGEEDLGDGVLLMRNLYGFRDSGIIMESIIDCGVEAVASGNADYAECGAVAPILLDPTDSQRISVVYQPIYPAFNPNVVAGFVSTHVHWEDTFVNIVPDYVDGFVCVVSNGVEALTYEMHNGVPEFVGEGDHHDPNFDEYVYAEVLNDRYTGAKASQVYTLSVYPTEEFMDQFRTNIPIFASVGFAAAIIFCMGIFFLYDSFMQYESNQQKRILDVKRRFVRFISHEIRTPLNVVSMGLDLLQAEIRDRAHMQRMLGFSALPEEGDECSETVPLKEESAPVNGRVNGRMKPKKMDCPMNYWLHLTQEIKENSVNALSVLNDLLNYDKVESGTFELEMGRVDIWSSVWKTWNEFSIQAKNRNIDLVFQMTTDLGEALTEADENGNATWGKTYVYGDDRRLSQVTRNLVSNALKFTPEGKSVSIKVSYEENGLEDALPCIIDDDDDDDKEGNQILSTSERAGSVLIQVVDEGVGLTQEQLGLLFREGVQFDANVLQHGGGSGLGLCISKEIVQMHSGTVVADSKGKGYGTTFTVELPLYRSTSKSEVASSVSEIASSIRQNGPHHILVVDDVLTNTKMLVRVLQRAGHTCVVSMNGQEAVDAFLENQKALEAGETESMIDTVLMDFEMPVMNGPDATKKLRELGCKARIFGVTGNVLAEDVAFFKSSGADSVLFKPISLSVVEGAWDSLDVSKRR
eukprot:Nitzschia sp. Nitz4//scaffold91_size79674//2396//5074//NITZ4_005353-RA/size79674-processed-gene-0.86-mRNA-1//1//CDS//3329560058//1676//frame0